MGITNLSEADVRRWLWLRAVEWCSFPAFVSQPIVPVLLVFFPAGQVILSVFLSGVVWAFVRYSYVNIFIANSASIFVAWLKWPTAIGCSIYLLTQKQYLTAAISLIWPLVAGLIGIPGKVGVIELLFARKIGYVDEDVSL